MKCSEITTFGRKCVRKAEFADRCYQHKKKNTDIDDLNDFQLLDILSYNFLDYSLKDLRDILISLSNEKRRYFLRNIGLDPSTPISFFDKMEKLSKFPEIRRKRFIKLFNEMPNDQRRFFLIMNKLEPTLTLEDLDKIFYITDIEMDEQAPDDATEEEADLFYDNHTSRYLMIDNDDDITFRPDEVVLPRRKKISIVFDYPLQRPIIKTFTSPNPEGITRREVLEFIKEGYNEIYEDFEGNGVWGHGIGDLVLAEVQQNDDRLILTVDS